MNLAPAEGGGVCGMVHGRGWERERERQDSHEFVFPEQPHDITGCAQQRHFHPVPSPLADINHHWLVHPSSLKSGHQLAAWPIAARRHVHQRQCLRDRQVSAGTSAGATNTSTSTTRRSPQGRTFRPIAQQGCKRRTLQLIAVLVVSTSSLLVTPRAPCHPPIALRRYVQEYLGFHFGQDEPDYMPYAGAATVGRAVAGSGRTACLTWLWDGGADGLGMRANMLGCTTPEGLARVWRREQPLVALLTVSPFDPRM